jgi:peroxiredoxin
MPSIESPIRLGDPLPALELEAQDGTGRSLPTGKPAMLIFYRGQWCPYCRWELTGLQTISRAAEELGAEIIAISPDSPSESADLRQRLGLTFTILSDPELKVTDRFGLRHRGGRASTGQDMPFPTTFIVDPGGVVRGKIENETYRDRPSPKDVLAILQKVLAESD